jgi:hypothetical protein
VRRLSSFFARGAAEWDDVTDFDVLAISADRGIPASCLRHAGVRGLRPCLGSCLLHGSKRQEHSALCFADPGQACDVNALIPTMGPQRARTAVALRIPQPYGAVRAATLYEPTVPRTGHVIDQAV